MRHGDAGAVAGASGAAAAKGTGQKSNAATTANGSGTRAGQGSASDAGVSGRDAGNAEQDAAPASDDASSGGDSAPLRCGNGRVDSDERCDIGLREGQAGACPTECPSTACAQQALVGSGCDAHCEPVPETCADDDGCCPADCDASNDNDCSASCGDGIVQTDEGENCEPGSDTPCKTLADCDDHDPCTTDTLIGSDANCNTSCEHTDVTELRPNDGCCQKKVNANANTDNDCKPVCGNMVVEKDEACDGTVGCDAQCHLTMTPDQLHCTLDFPADDCRACECVQCTQKALDCFDSGDATRDAACISMESCGRDKDCANEACYCGDAFLCLTPNGPCVDAIEAAAGTQNPIEVQNQADDENSAVYRANDLGACSVEKCSNVCP